MRGSHIPAIRGGQPVRSSMLPYGRQWIDRDDCEAVMQVLRSDFLTTGPAIAQFEAKVASYVGAKYAVAFSSGTAALHAACHAAGIGAGDEVITSPFTFVATANAVLYTGARPVFADIDINTYNIDPLCIQHLITPHTKALLPVDYAGRPVDHDEIASIAKKNGLLVIEDAAHALGASYQGKRVGTLADMTMFSFHPVKAVTTGEGGVVTTDEAYLCERLRQFRSHGVTRDPAKCEHYEGAWYYEMQYLGVNARMTDIQAALGNSQMAKLDAFLRRRREIVRQYQIAFARVDGLITPPADDDAHAGWHLYAIRVAPERLKVGRKEIYDALRAENIGVNVHYIPVYKHPYYRQLGYSAGLCPVAEQCYDTVITLPLFPAMSNQDAEDVIEAVRKVFNYYVQHGHCRDPLS